MPGPTATSTLHVHWTMATNNIVGFRPCTALPLRVVYTDGGPVIGPKRPNEAACCEYRYKEPVTCYEVLG